MSDNNTPKGQTPDQNDNSADDLDWLELESENFDDSDFDESYADPEDTKDTELKAKNRSDSVERKQKKGSSSKLILVLIAALGGAAIYLNFFNPQDNGNKVSEDAVPVVSLDSSPPTAAEQPELPVTAALVPPDVSNEQQALDLPPAEGSVTNQNILSAPDEPAPQQSVLTPMPDLLTAEGIDLPALEEDKLSDIKPSIPQESPETSLNAKVTAIPPSPPAVVTTTIDTLPQNDALDLVPPDVLSAPTPKQDTLSETALLAQTDKQPEPQKPVSEPSSTDNTIPALPSDVGSEIAVQKSVEKEKPPTEANPSAATSTSVPTKEISTQAPTTRTEPVQQAQPSKPKEVEKIVIEQPKSAPETPVEISKPKEEIKAKPPEKQSETVKKVVAPSWQLRSAQPGAAVIFDPGTGNMQSIEVGDRVEGVGRIKSITLVNGKWVVLGNSGRISQ